MNVNVEDMTQQPDLRVVSHCGCGVLAMDVMECSPLFEMSTLRQRVIACPNNNHKCPVSVELATVVSALRQRVSACPNNNHKCPVSVELTIVV